MSEPYTDPKIRGHEYAKFVQRLHAGRLVDFSLEKTTEFIGMFCVAKKTAGELRLVLDCRLSNCHFEVPLGVSLASGTSFSELQIGVDDTLFMGTADIVSALFCTELPH